MYIENKHLFEDLDNQYNQYLDQHIGNVQQGYDWLKENLPEILSEDNYVHETSYYGELDEIIEQHDKSKYNKIPNAENYYDLACEWDAYNDYFYGEKTPEVESSFNKAQLAHIHANPHHWQHQLLQHDDEGLEALEMPYVFTIEMICDWWSFSWKSDNLYEIFDWYDKHRSSIIFNSKTREVVQSILDKIKEKLDAEA